MSKRRRTLEALEKQITTLEKENRRLKRLLRQSNKFPKMEKNKDEPKKSKCDDICPDCGKGTLIPMQFELNTYQLNFTICDVCDYKTKERIRK